MNDCSVSAKGLSGGKPGRDDCAHAAQTTRSRLRRDSRRSRSERGMRDGIAESSAFRQAAIARDRRCFPASPSGILCKREGEDGRASDESERILI